jgi:vancomycin permeability regulator SanA
MAKKNKSNELLFPSLLLLLQLLFLYFIKYMNQYLPINNFSLLKTGNIINFFLYGGVIAGLIFVAKRKSGFINKKIQITLLILSWLLLILAFVSTKIKIISDAVYYLNQPGDKVLTGFLFLFYWLSLLYFVVYLWSGIIISQKSKIIKTIFTTFVIVILFFVIIIIYIDNVGYTSGRWVIKRSPENIAVVLGAAVWSGNVPSPTLAARVDKALDLLDQGFVGKVVLTGGKAPGELPESEVAFEYAKVKGVDTSLIIIEKYTSSTTNQIQWLKNNISNEDYPGEIILISDAYHLPRAIEISKFFNLDVKVAESTHKMNFKDLMYNKIRESIALFNFWNFAL